MSKQSFILHCLGGNPLYYTRNPVYNLAWHICAALRSENEIAFVMVEFHDYGL